MKKRKKEKKKESRKVKKKKKKKKKKGERKKMRVLILRGHISREYQIDYIRVKMTTTSLNGCHVYNDYMFCWFLKLY